LRPNPPNQHRKYIQGRKAFPLRPINRLHKSADDLFDNMAKPEPFLDLSNERKDWISEQTWNLIDQRAAHLHAEHNGRPYNFSHIVTIQ
jgi:hypothetical protein